MVAQVTAGYIKDMQVVLHIPWWFWLLVFLANPQARTGLPFKIGILLQHCRQSQARPLSITSRLVPNPLAVTFPLISVGQTYACQRNVCTLAVASGVAPSVGGWWHVAEPSPRALCSGDAGESGCQAGCYHLQHRLWFVHRTGAHFVHSDHHVTSTA